MEYLHIVNIDMSDKLFKPHSITHASTRTHRTMFSLRTGDGTRTTPRLSKHVTCRRLQTFIGASCQAYTREAYADGGPCTPTAVNLPPRTDPHNTKTTGWEGGSKFFMMLRIQSHNLARAVIVSQTNFETSARYMLKRTCFWATVQIHALKLSDALSKKFKNSLKKTDTCRHGKHFQGRWTYHLLARDKRISLK